MTLSSVFFHFKGSYCIELIYSFSFYYFIKYISSSLQAVVDAVLTIAKPIEPIDLFMVEIMEMKHKTDCDTQ